MHSPTVSHQQHGHALRVDGDHAVFRELRLLGGDDPG
jgi:hypothetical protein